MSYPLYILTVIVLFLSRGSNAQDAQFTQYYASSTYLNPAFAGVPSNFNVGLQFRDQWAGLGNHYTSTLGHAEHLFEKAKSGVGFLYHTNKEGSGNYTSSEYSGIYSFRLDFENGVVLLPAIQGSYMQRSIDYSGLDFPDQYSTNGLTGATAEQFGATNTSFVDFSAGFLSYSKSWFAGAAIHHLSEPNQSFIGDDKLAMKVGAHAGYKVFFDGSALKEKSWLFTANYKAQNKFDQFDLGTYLTLEPIVFGLWYRGIPIKTFNDLHNHESVIGIAGVKVKTLTIAYSFDYVLSSLSGPTGMVHEVSLNYGFYVKKPEKTPKMGLPIPMF